MISILKSIFGSDGNGKELLDAGVKSIDALYFTDEEKSVASQKLLSTYIDFQKSTQAQNVARRYLAFLVTAIWCFLVLIITALSVGAAYFEDPNTALAAKAVTTVMGDYVFVPFSGIMTFYFLTHMLRANKGVSS